MLRLEKVIDATNLIFYLNSQILCEKGLKFKRINKVRRNVSFVCEKKNSFVLLMAFQYLQSKCGMFVRLL